LNVDDPQRVLTKADAAELENTLHWFAEVLPTRLNDRKRGAIVVTMQRVHERDVSGYALERDLGYTHLCLPMRYESNHPYVSGFDVREDDGELLWEDRLGEKEVVDLEKTLGSYASAGQLQQRPAPREGGMFKRNWLPIVPAMPSQVADRVRAWDLAGTAKTLLSSDPDWTCGVRMSLGLDGIFYIEDVYKFRESPAQVDQNIFLVAQHDRRSTRIRLPQDPGQAGKAQANYHAKLLAGFVFKIKPATGSKESWAAPLAAQAEAGNVRLVEGDWNQEFIDELCNFPTGAHDDQVDAAAQAFDAIINRDMDDKKKQKRTARTFSGAW
jgi:predicted phage terminase large subunit-like protein